MIYKEELIKFVEWTKLKIRIHAKKDEEIVYFRELEIWWASLGVNVGYEEDGKHEKFERPILILKKFNKHILWALPITSKQREGFFYHQLNYFKKEYFLILPQLKLISSKRLLRRIRKIDVGEFEIIKGKVKGLL